MTDLSSQMKEPGARWQQEEGWEESTVPQKPCGPKEREMRKDYN